METETPTPTLTPTETATATPTYTPTLAYIVETELSDGTAARFEQSVTAGDYTVSVLLAVLLLSIWAMWVYERLREWRGDK